LWFCPNESCLKISSLNEENNKSVSIACVDREWIIISPHLPSFVMASRNIDVIAKNIFSIFSEENKTISLSTQFFCEPRSLTLPYLHLTEKSQNIANQQVLNSLLHIDDNDLHAKQALMKQAFDAKNKTLCEALIGKGIDFSDCGIDFANKEPGEYQPLFDSLLESQQVFSINRKEQLKQQFFSLHKTMFDNDKNKFFSGSRRHTDVQSSQWGLKEIIGHARAHDSRTRTACVELKWLNEDRSLHQDAPKEIRSIYNEIPLKHQENSVK